MEEMLDDTLDMDEDEELEEEADAEVEKVLFELTNGKLGEAGSVGTELPVSSFDWINCMVFMMFTHLQSVENKLDDAETERTMEQYRQQLNGILSG